MKARILKSEATEKFSITTEIEIYEDDGTMVYKGNLNIFTVAGTEEEVNLEIHKAISNKYQQIQNEKNAVLSEVVTDLLNKEIVF